MWNKGDDRDTAGQVNPQTWAAVKPSGSVSIMAARPDTSFTEHNGGILQLSRARALAGA